MFFFLSFLLFIPASFHFHSPFIFYVSYYCPSPFFLITSHRFHRGDVLITTATGVMTEEEGDKWGLVPTHAYAVLDIRDHKVGILCLGE